MGRTTGLGDVQFKTKPFDARKAGMREFSGLAIAIPEKKLNEVLKRNTKLIVLDKLMDKQGILSYMVFTGKETPKTFGRFVDKWRDGEEYTLCYFDWKPLSQLSLL